MILNHFAFFPRRFPPSQSFSTRSLVKLSKWLSCSSVNFLQNREESDCRAETLTGPDTHFRSFWRRWLDQMHHPRTLSRKESYLPSRCLSSSHWKVGCPFFVPRLFAGALRRLRHTCVHFSNEGFPDYCCAHPSYCRYTFLLASFVDRSRHLRQR